MKADDGSLFRFVFFRGPDASRVIDPTDDVGAVESASHGRPLDERQLRERIPWFGLAQRLREKPGLDLTGVTIPVDGAAAPVSTYAATPQFREAYRALAVSWTTLWAAGRHTGTELRVHAHLLATARLLHMLAQDPGQVEQEAVVTTPVVAPRAIRRRPAPAAGGDPGKGQAGRRPPVDAGELADLRERYSEHAGRAASLERVRTKLARLRDEPGPGSAEALVSRLGPSLSGDEKTALSAVPLTGLGAAWQVDAAIEDMVATEHSQADRLCSRIRLYEDREQTSLPAPRPDLDPGRPAIGAVGFGELYVVDEALDGYLAREIAHIENVLPGELKARDFERTHSVETLVEVEEQQGTTSERDLETSQRFELRSEASKVVNSELSAEAGVNVTAEYGLANITSSLDLTSSQSTQSTSSRATTLAKDVVMRAVERTEEQVRELRRTVTIDTIRELARHEIDNRPAGDHGATAPVSGVYLWVEKISRLQLKHYGRRLFVEIYVPEPGLSLLGNGAVNEDRPRKPAPLTLDPAEIAAPNFRCLTRIYGARDVAPPPPLFKHVGAAFSTTPDSNDNEMSAQDTFATTLTIPAGYRPVGGHFAVTGRGSMNTKGQGRDEIHAHIACAGQTVLDSVIGIPSGPLFEPTYQGSFSLTGQAPSEGQSFPVTVRISSHAEKAGVANVSIRCERTTEVFQQWQLDTYDRIREAHDALVTEYEQALDVASFTGLPAGLGGRPATVNRRIERDELRKWAIKVLRVQPFTEDAVVEQQGVATIDPVAADALAPVVRFFEDAFEWDRMNWFLYPYFWGRRAAWGVRRSIEVPSDPAHEQFLRAGGARVVIPVTPGQETRVLHYLRSDPGAPEWDPANPSARIPATRTPQEGGSADNPFAELWLELLESRDTEIARGAGTLSVTNGSTTVSVSAGGWRVGDRDIGREVTIAAERYTIVDHEADGLSFELDRAYTGPTNPAAAFATGPVNVGQPWRVVTPTRLIVLAGQEPALPGPPA